MKTLRVRVSVVSAAVLVLLLSGCGGSADESATASAGSPVAAPDASLATAPSNPTEPGRCHTADLTVTIQETKGGERLTFTNASDHPCTLEGFPGVSLVAGDAATQVGSDFARDGDKTTKITLKPGDDAKSDLVLASPGSAKCEAAEAGGFRVYPPEETAAIFVSSPQETCKEKDKGIGKVKPLAA